MPCAVCHSKNKGNKLLNLDCFITPSFYFKENGSGFLWVKKGKIIKNKKGNGTITILACVCVSVQVLHQSGILSLHLVQGQILLWRSFLVATNEKRLITVLPLITLTKGNICIVPIRILMCLSV